jgi:Fe-S-cluster containining protein
MCNKLTFHFCNICPKDSNCCTGKYVDLPVLTPEDTSRISQYSDLAASKFSFSGNSKLSNMKNINKKCYFYQSGRCSIYEERPIDCKLFPFGIRLNEKDELLLVLYASACPTEVNIKPYFASAKELVKEFYPYIEEYDSVKAPLLDQYDDYKILEVLPFEFEE